MKSKNDNLLTWERLERAEPQLAELLDEVRSMERAIWATCEDGEIRLYRYVREAYFSDTARPRLRWLVGPGRPTGSTFMKTRDAYEVASRKLYAALPPDFTEAEIDEALELACELDFEDDEAIALSGPAA